MHCPSCGGEFREGFSECSDCKVSLVAAAPRDLPAKRIAMFPTVPKTDDRPLVVKWIPFFALVHGCWMLLVLMVGLDIVTIGGWNVASMDLPATALAALAALAIAAAFWRERPWSRHLFLACFAVSALRAGLLSGSLEEIFRFDSYALGLPTGLVGLVLAGWYFYGKDNVRAYYRSLKRDRSEAPNPALAG